MDKQKAVLTALTAFNIIKNNHAESEKIGLQVDIERAESEKHQVDKQSAVIIRINHAESGKTTVEVNIEGAETEGHYVDKQNAT